MSAKANRVSAPTQYTEKRPALHFAFRSAHTPGRALAPLLVHLLEDAMIAATARVRGLQVATRNQKDFALFDVDTINPFRVAS